MNKNITREKISEYINSEFGLSKFDCNNIVNDIIIFYCNIRNYFWKLVFSKKNKSIEHNKKYKNSIY